MLVNHKRRMELYQLRICQQPSTDGLTWLETLTYILVSISSLVERLGLCLLWIWVLSHCYLWKVLLSTIFFSHTIILEPFFKGLCKHGILWSIPNCTKVCECTYISYWTASTYFCSIFHHLSSQHKVFFPSYLPKFNLTLTGYTCNKKTFILVYILVKTIKGTYFHNQVTSWLLN